MLDGIAEKIAAHPAFADLKTQLEALVAKVHATDLRTQRIERMLVDRVKGDQK